MRNEEMVKAGADLCLAFIRGNLAGASNTAKLAQEAGTAQPRQWVGQIGSQRPPAGRPLAVPEGVSWAVWLSASRSGCR
ncbi:hypothetical protein [Nocardia sp. NRRL S-836]|uniref:hypothetical protein n=1 Tax=Nocardia sp. NRRL S-836 TaxID=1519492 RepID=UPI0006AEDE63|nr:hypothetical protein [Nocardia sp. NRRL S-836]